MVSFIFQKYRSYLVCAHFCTNIEAVYNLLLRTIIAHYQKISLLYSLNVFVKDEINT